VLGPLPVLASGVPLASAAVLLVPGAAEHLEAARAGLAQGELWRLLGAHLAHYSFAHWLLDAVTFLALALACERLAPQRTRIALAASAIAIPVAVLALQPELERYRGLSGLDSTLFGLLLALELRARSSRVALACGALFLAKLAYELGTGRALFLDSQTIGFVPVPLAHALGALIGLVCGSVPAAAAKVPSQRDHRGLHSL
jgi:rhomboid family GlyGly-CTERM serine protease